MWCWARGNVLTLGITSESESHAVLHLSQKNYQYTSQQLGATYCFHRNHARPDVAGKVAIVAGSNTGIGAAIAQELSSRGASMVVNYPYCSWGEKKPLTPQLFQVAPVMAPAPVGQRMAMAEEIALGVGFLCEPRASWANSLNLVASGGLHIE